ncbi:hypothetical protein D3C72_2563650 [compost metagenome]
MHVVVERLGETAEVEVVEVVTPLRVVELEAIHGGQADETDKARHDEAGYHDFDQGEAALGLMV